MQMCLSAWMLPFWWCYLLSKDRRGGCLFMQAVAPSREYKFQTGLGKAVHGCTSSWFISTVFHTSGRVSRTYRGAAAFTLAESELPPANSSRSPRVSPMVPLIDYMQENDVAIRCPFNAARHTYDNKSPGWLWTRCSSGMVHLVVLFLRAISCPAFQLLSSKWVIQKKQPSKIIIFFFSPMVISYRRRSHTGVWEMIVTFVSLVFCKITSTLPVVAHLHISHFKDVHWMFVGNVHNVFLFFFSFNHSVLEAHIFLPYILCSSSLAVLFASALD